MNISNNAAAWQLVHNAIASGHPLPSARIPWVWDTDVSHDFGTFVGEGKTLAEVIRGLMEGMTSSRLPLQYLRLRPTTWERQAA